MGCIFVMQYSSRGRSRGAVILARRNSIINLMPAVDYFAVFSRKVCFLFTIVRMQDAELIEHLSESCVMSKSVDDYGERKSSAITTARRLAHFLGDERIKDKGLVCNYIIAQCAFILLISFMAQAHFVQGRS
jgi:hypothetical protein